MNDDTTRTVLRALLSDHVGRDNAITQSQLAEATGLNPSTLRSELRRLREERGIPIGNLRDGYFVIADREELQTFVGHINSEIQSKRQTIEDTLAAYDEFDADAVDIDSEDSGPQVIEQTYPCGNPECDRKMPKREAFWPDGCDRPRCKHCHGRRLIDGGQA